MDKRFLCPLPWISLSLGPKSTPRVCCHQTGALKDKGQKDFHSLISLKHNDSIKEQMLNGSIPSECMGCHLLEKSGSSSPRIQYQEIFNDVSDYTRIEYLDMTLDNRCNLECIMCSPSYSHRLNNFFSDLSASAFPKWELQFSDEEILSLLPDLKMLTITGGEPLLSPKGLKTLRLIAQSGEASHIKLRLFSNLTVLPSDIKEILSSFLKVELILSIDSINENYELIRYPAKWPVVYNHIKSIQALKLKYVELNIHAVLMATNWIHIGDLINFYQHESINSLSLLPIFVEIDNPQYLHPRVLSENDFQIGMANIQKSLKKLMPKNSIQEAQLDNFICLLEKISQKDFHHQFIEHKIYMNKIRSHREELRPNVL